MERVKLHENVNVDDLYIGKSVWRVVSVEYKKRMRVSSNRKIVYVWRGLWAVKAVINACIRVGLRQYPLRCDPFSNFV